jgi:hypothetical protein
MAFRNRKYSCLARPAAWPATGPRCRRARRRDPRHDRRHDAASGVVDAPLARQDEAAALLASRISAWSWSFSP